MSTITKSKPSAGPAWFRQARYGLFIHYGPYSDIGRHEWSMCYERTPVDEYRSSVSSEFGRDVNVEEWCQLAKAAGMKYACLTAKHHDGFCLFETKTTEFNAPILLDRDLIGEFVEACRKHHLRIGIYFSVADWSDKGFIRGVNSPRIWGKFVSAVHTQLEELFTNYGEIHYLFYDGCPPPETWQAREINARIRQLQPEILISSRCGLNEDIRSAEGHTISDPGSLWESCITTNKSWGYNYGDHDWKTPREIVLFLMTCAHNGGNLLLNIGPDRHGKTPRKAVSLLKKTGAWVRANAEAIYDTEPHPLDYADQKLSTGKGHIVFIPLHYYHGPHTVIAGIVNRVIEARLLYTQQEISFIQEGNRIRLIGLTEEPADPYLPIIKLTLKGKPRGVPNPLLGTARFN